MGPDAILRCFADLAEHTATHDARGDHPHARLAPDLVDLGRAEHRPAWLGTSLALPLVPDGVAPTLIRDPDVRHLAAVDALAPAAHRLRIGWVVAAGRVRTAQGALVYCFPLISQAVTVERDLARGPNLTVRPVGDMALTPLVTDPDRGAALEEDKQFGSGRLDHDADAVTPRSLGRLTRLQSWIRDVVAACGLPPVTSILPPGEDPRDHRSRVGLVACVGAVLHAAPGHRPAPAAALRQWAADRRVPSTAFATVYGLDSPPAGAPAPEPMDAPVPLSPVQQAAATRPRHEPLTVVAGPPGSGKTHTAVAVAVDVVSRGGSVLLATGSQQSADSLAAVFTSCPGPAPLRFGRVQRGEVLAGATGPGATGAEVRAAEHTLAEARARQAMLERVIDERLTLEQRALAAGRWTSVSDHLDTVAPRASRLGAPERLGVLLARAQGGDDDRRWRRWRARWAEARLRTLVRADAGEPLSEVALAVRAAQDRATADGLAVAGGTALARVWADLATADDEALAAAGHLAIVRTHSELRRRRGRSAAENVHALLTAGPRRRRQLLHRVDATGLVATLPLWLGTVAEIDDLLPRVAGLFDLVVLDDAGQIDQLAAAGALLRARRAAVIGDPHQLRRVVHADEGTVRVAVSDHGLDAQASRLDLRHASVLDVAMGATRVSWLDEHFRSVPQLVDFPARRFYEGRIRAATRHPTNDGASAVRVVRTGRLGDGDGDEVHTALDQVEHLAVLGETDIAVVSPFPETVDALRTALLERYDLDEVDRLGLTVGTVGDYAAASSDHVVVALGLARDDPPTRRHRVEDPDLFNVMITRARHRLVVVTSLPAPSVERPAGLIDAFLDHTGRPPRPAQASRPAVGAPDHGPATAAGAATELSDWVVTLAGAIRALGEAAQVSYPVGRWVVDICAGKDGDAVAVETAVHPDGVTAHIERHRALRRTGWRIVDGYPSRWGGDADRAAFDITETLRHH